MAISPLNSKLSFHARSNSLPSKPHPLVTQVDEQLCRLRSADQTSSSSSSSISHKLSTLHDLHDCIDNLLVLRLSDGFDQKCIDKLLEGSLRPLDLCDIAKDTLPQTKESAQDLLSVLRRRRGGETEILSELHKCINSRKMIKKTIHKFLKGIESYKQVEKNHESLAIVGLLKDAEEVTFCTVKSLLFFEVGIEVQ